MRQAEKAGLLQQKYTSHARKTYVALLGYNLPGTAMPKVTRRSFVTTIGAASVVPAAAMMSTSAAAAAAKAAHDATPSKPTYLFFNADEVLFIEAACERLIPADELGPGALGAGVPNYLDKQLGGAWGAGDNLKTR